MCIAMGLIKEGWAQRILYSKRPLIRFMRDAAELGVKAISITGEAEPTMNPAVYDAVLEGNRAGLSIGLATWGGTLKRISSQS